MTLKPISMQKPPYNPSLRIFNLNKQQISETSGSQLNNPSGYELLDTSITVRQNEEFIIVCAVESSRPAAEIRFALLDSSTANGGNDDPPLINSLHSLNSNTMQSYLTLSPNIFATPAPPQPALIPLSTQPASVIDSSSIVTANSDKTLKTVHTARLRVTRADHNKVISCKAENGFSNQKWENKKLLNVLCKTYFIA